MSPIVDRSGKVTGFLAVQRDVSERRRVETALRETARRYQALANAAEDSIFIVSRSGEIEYANVVSATRFGMRAEAIIGKRLEDVFPANIAAEMWRQLSQVFSTGTKQLFEQRFQAATGEIWLEAWLVPLTGADAYVDCVMGVARDVTQRKLLEREYLQAQKMEAVGRLAGGIAHDFNNLLTAILGYSELVQERVRNIPAVLDDVEEIKKAGERAGRLTRQLLAFTRKQPMRPQLVDISAIVADAKRMIERVVGEDIELSVFCDDAISPVVGDPGQIEQVLLNLIVNARDAMPRGGRLRVSTANVELDADAARNHPDATQGRYVRLGVEDSGCGMTPEVIAHIFEPFFTTKAAGKGTGLGLSTVYGIAKQNGGWIAVESKPQSGTTISIFWPVDEGSSTPDSDHAPRADVSLRGTETILLVEDERGIRSLMRRTLEVNGYHVLEAADVPDALRIAEAYDGPIHLLLTDIVMPVMNGPEVARKIGGRRPTIKVLLVSGYPESLASEHQSPRHRIWFLSKPFTPQALAAGVRECLNAGTSSDSANACVTRTSTIA